MERFRCGGASAVAETETPRDSTIVSGAETSGEWAWVELNYRPHAYQPPKPDADQWPPA